MIMPTFSLMLRVWFYVMCSVIGWAEPSSSAINTKKNWTLAFRYVGSPHDHTDWHLEADTVSGNYWGTLFDIIITIDGVGCTNVQCCNLCHMLLCFDQLCKQLDDPWHSSKTQLQVHSDIYNYVLLGPVSHNIPRDFIIDHCRGLFQEVSVIPEGPHD